MGRCWGCVQENCQDCSCSCHVEVREYKLSSKDRRIAELEAEVARLKPKPVERTIYMWFRDGHEIEYGTKQTKNSNVKIKLSDGVPVSAEVCK